MKIPEEYLRDMAEIAHTDLAYRCHVAERLLARNGDVLWWNRSLYDAVRLLQEEWSANPEWSFLDLRELHPEQLELPQELEEKDPGLRERLLDDLREAIQHTPESFEALRDDPNRPQGTEPDRFMEWFYRYAPYLTVGLTPDRQGFDTAVERLRWFETQLEDEILRDAVLSYGKNILFEWLDEVRAAGHDPRH